MNLPPDRPKPSMVSIIISFLILNHATGYLIAPPSSPCTSRLRDTHEQKPVSKLIMSCTSPVSSISKPPLNEMLQNSALLGKKWTLAPSWAQLRSSVNAPGSSRRFSFRRSSRLFTSSSDVATNVTTAFVRPSAPVANGASTPLQEARINIEDDHPIPTAAGGFTHTASSRAKISAANKGKEPWNKGRTRSPEERARISAGVKARNRLKLEEKCAAMNITVEEFEKQKAAEKKKKRAEKNKRRTANGGYTPTEETKKKISDILKAKWRNGEIDVSKRKKRELPGSRLGVPHTEETKDKIRKALKDKWSQDKKYREKMTLKSSKQTSKKDIRARISNTLKEKWKDPEFRAYMMERMKTRKSIAGTVNKEEHRRKISETMRKKWQDPEYREKAMKGMANKRGASGGGVRRRAAPERSLKPRRVLTELEKKIAAERRVSRRNKRAASKTKAPTAPKKPKVKVNKIDPIEERKTRMKEEQSDLYELLYGADEVKTTVNTEVGTPSISMATSFLDDDEDDFDLDSYDPYGLDQIEKSRVS